MSSAPAKVEMSPLSDFNTAVLAASPVDKSTPYQSDLEHTNVHPMSLQQYNPRLRDIFLLGITIVIGGQYFSWNAGLSAGLASFSVAYVLMGTAYVTFCCCMSEVTAVLPFSGGAYGLSRCTLGFYIGFLIGCCEALAYIVYVSTSVISFGQMIIDAAPGLEGFEPLIWLLFYLSALGFHLRGDRVFWVFNLVLAVVSLLVLLIYCFGSIPFLKVQQYALDDPLATFTAGGGFSGFMKSLPLTSWFFVGIEALNLASDQVATPKQTIPKAQIACILTLFVSGALVLFVSVSLPTGVTALVHEQVPFNRGFTRMFGMSQSAAAILSLPATYATAFGFIWGYGKLISAMALSKLLPHFLSKTSPSYGTPTAAIVCGSTLSFVICLIFHYTTINDYTYITCVTCAFTTYIAQCISYISVRRNYRNSTPGVFRSPFGVVGALFSMCVWLLSLVSVAAYQGNGGIEILMFLGIVALLSAFYFLYARKRQTLSEQERRILLVARDLI